MEVLPAPGSGDHSKVSTAPRSRDHLEVLPAPGSGAHSNNPTAPSPKGAGVQIGIRVIEADAERIAAEGGFRALVGNMKKGLF